ncbi:MAG TPA: phosphoadenylyl-sulfate reductase [Rhodospirillales bacterium]
MHHIVPSPSEEPTEARARRLADCYAGKTAADIIEAMVGCEFPGLIALVSSFGAESAVMLHIAVSVDPALPVIFLDTGKLFPETLEYCERLVDALGLRDVRRVTPAARDLLVHDPRGDLWADHANSCCHIRKVLPLKRALVGFDAWFTGRKRHQGGDRARLEVFEAQDGRVKVNPLAHWDRHRIDTYLRRNRLPRHPLEAKGYPSIGCISCTAPVGAGEEPRAGRWRGLSKSECGIHLAARPEAFRPSGAC